MIHDMKAATDFWNTTIISNHTEKSFKTLRNSSKNKSWELACRTLNKLHGIPTYLCVPNLYVAAIEISGKIKVYSIVSGIQSQVILWNGTYCSDIWVHIDKSLDPWNHVALTYTMEAIYTVAQVTYLMTSYPYVQWKTFTQRTVWVRADIQGGRNHT